MMFVGKMPNEFKLLIKSYMYYSMVSSHEKKHFQSSRTVQYI